MHCTARLRCLASLLVAAAGVLATLKGCQALAAQPEAARTVPIQTSQEARQPEYVDIRWAVYTIGIAASIFFIVRRQYDIRDSA